jgi:hypothetical protein
MARDSYTVMLRPRDRWAADVIVQCLQESQDPWIIGRHITVRNSDLDDDRTSVEGPDGFTGRAIGDVLDKVLGSDDGRTQA